MTLKQYSPEYNAKLITDRRVIDAQRKRVWTSVYAVALAEALKTTDDAGRASSSAAMHAECAVQVFDHAWRDTS